jgi:M6 family metalloprotease-like protein
MRIAISVLALCLLSVHNAQAQSNLGFDNGSVGQLPPGWFISADDLGKPKAARESALRDYPVGIAEFREDGCLTGTGCVFLRDSIYQRFPAGSYRGHIIKLVGWFRPVDGNARPELRFRVNEENLTVTTFEPVDSSLVSDSSGWQRQEIMGYVSENAKTIDLAVQRIAETGVWVDDLSIIPIESGPLNSADIPQEIREAYNQIDNALQENNRSNVLQHALLNRTAIDGPPFLPFDSRIAGFQQLVGPGTRVTVTTSIGQAEIAGKEHVLVRARTRVTRSSPAKSYVYELRYRDFWILTASGWKLTDLPPEAIAAKDSAEETRAGRTIWRPDLPCGVPSIDALSLGATNYGFSLPPRGSINAAMLFIDFDDARSAESIPDLYNRLALPFIEWIDEASHGMLSIRITPADHWYHLAARSSKYSIGRTGGSVMPLVNDVVAMADLPDLAEYDIVYIVSSRNPNFSLAGDNGPMITRGGTVRPGRGIPVGNDGDFRELRSFVVVGRDAAETGDYESAEVKVLLHETAHVFGLPDLYLTRDRPGDWDLMNAFLRGAHLTGWSKSKMGWMGREHVRCVTGTEVIAKLGPVSSQSGTQLLIIPQGNGNYYAVELREWLGIDASLCAEGILVYQVLTAVPSTLRIEEENEDSGEGRRRCGPTWSATLQLRAGHRTSLANEDIVVDLLQQELGEYTVRVRRVSHK